MGTIKKNVPFFNQKNVLFVFIIICLKLKMYVLFSPTRFCLQAPPSPSYGIVFISDCVHAPNWPNSCLIKS